MVVIGRFDNRLSAATDRGPLRSRRTRLDSPLVARKGHFFLVCPALHRRESAFPSIAVMPDQPARHVGLVQQANHPPVLQPHTANANWIRSRTAARSVTQLAVWPTSLSPGLWGSRFVLLCLGGSFAVPGQPASSSRSAGSDACNGCAGAARPSISASAGGTST